MLLGPLVGPLVENSNPTCSSPSVVVVRGWGHVTKPSGQRSSGRGESGKHIWPRQMGCDMRPTRGKSPVRQRGMCCQMRAGGENLRQLKGVCVCVCVFQGGGEKVYLCVCVTPERNPVCALDLLSWQRLRKSRSRFSCV